MNKVLGNIFKGVGIVLDYLLSGIIFIVSILVNIFSSLKDALVVFFSFAGCLLFFFLWIPWIFSPELLLGILIVMIFPLVGQIAVSFLKYIQYMLTEYFYDKADYYLLGKEASFDSMGDYGRRYQRMREQERIRKEQERIRREQERRRAQEEAFREQWEEFARQFGQGGFYGNWQSGQGYNQGGYQQGGYQGGAYGPGATGSGFKEKYEAACAELGVNPPSDKYEIKTAYRRMAKKYHPDINKDPGATERFQKINDAYEFLSDEAIERYKRNFH